MASKRTMPPNSLKNLKPWPKGVSGNPHGRPQNKFRITNEIRDRLDEVCTDEKLIKKLKLPPDVTWAKVIAVMAVGKAAKGDIKAMREIADRDEGKPKQRIELMGDSEGNEIRIRVIYDEPKERKP